MIRIIKCFLFGHLLDWTEYDKRIEKEGHYADGRFVYCYRCRSYKKMKMRKIHEAPYEGTIPKEVIQKAVESIAKERKKCLKK